MSELREFHLGDILSITSGYLLSPRKMDGVYDILNFLTGDNLFTHQLGRASEAAKPYLLERYPELVIHTGMTHEAKRSLGDSWGANFYPPDGRPRCETWLIGYCSQLGYSYLSLEAMPPGAWLQIDLLKELAAMVGEDKVIVLEAPEAPHA